MTLRFEKLLIILLLLSVREVVGIGAAFANWTCGINTLSRLVSYVIALPCEVEVNDCCYMHDRCYEKEHEHPLLYWQSDCDEKFCRCLNEPCSSKHTVDFKNFPKDPVQYARFEKMPQPLYMFVIVVVADLSLNVSVFGSKVQKLAAVT
uniref:Phospholipase A2 domain-containing protein n=1 Tax=Ascaris lumbricoides TaxID=6252 RepID=A0A9J2PAC9_ASCLU